MRIVCDNCGAKYQISDDKVRNKVFKIRCKKCSHTIVVRSKGDGPAASGESNEDATRVAPAPADAGGSVEAAPDAIWYVVVNREQVGPMTPAEVERRYKAGEIDADAFTWAEGMTDWIRLAAVTEFAHMFPEKAPARAAAPVRAAAAPVAVAAAPAAKGGGLFPRDEGDDDVMVSGNDSPGTGGGGADRLFGGVDDDEPAPSSPRVEDGPRLRSQRNENSVLFSLDSLSSAAESPRVTNTGGTEGSGLIDISAMLGGGGSSSASSGNDSFGGPIGLAPSAPAPMAGAPLPSLVNRKKSNTGLIVGIVAGAVIIAGGIVAAVVLKGGDKPAEPVATNNAPAVVSVGGDAPKSAAPATQPASAAAVASAAASEPASAAAPVSVAANDAAGKPAPGGGGAARPAGGGGGPRVAAGGGRPGGGDEDTPSVAAPRPASPTPAPATDAPKPQKKGGGEDVDDILGALDGKGGAKPAGGGGKPAAAAAPADDPLLPEQLTKPQILGVVKKAAGQISSCKERDPNASGTVMVSIQIEKSGRVGKATAKAPFAGTPVGNCVESTVRTFQFPQFSGDQMTINMPFAL